MTSFLEIIFFTSLFAVFYAYIGYTGLLWILTYTNNDPVKKENITPAVSLVISVYNEEDILSHKIENSLEIDYPEDLLEIAVISDGSTDKTNDIIEKYQKRNDRIRPFIAPVNKGKTACLNDFVPKLNGEIVVFSDANSFYSKDSITKIVRSFADDRVGFVTGSTKYISSFESKASEITSLYSKLEKLTKVLESRIGSCVGADGAIFAIRKNLYKTLGPHDMNDFGVPLNIIRKGYRGVLDQDVYCREKVSPTIKGEYRRQIRITSRTIRTIFSYADLLNPIRHPLFSFQLVSHKLFKFFVPWFLILILSSNFILAISKNNFFLIILFLQIFFYECAFVGWAFPFKFKMGRLMKFCYSFVYMNIAIFMGWLSYSSGETYTTWTPERQ